MTRGMSCRDPSRSSFIRSRATMIRSSPARRTLGGAGFRPGALPIIIVATDCGTVYEDDGSDWITGVTDAAGNPVSVSIDEFENTSRPGSGVGGRGATIQEAIDALIDLGALVVGVGIKSYPEWDPRGTLEAISRLTGAVNGRTDTSIDSGIPDDPIEFGDPLYLSLDKYIGAIGGNDRIGDAVATAIETALKTVTFDVNLVASDPEALFDNVTGTVAGVGPDATATFNVHVTGDGVPRCFDLQFLRAGTARRVAQVMQRKFHKSLHPHYITQWLARRRITPQKPERQARERDERKVRRWLREEWPRIKKVPGVGVRTWF